MKHCNIPVFIPHLGCPHRCVFCDQNSISGCAEFDEKNVPERIETALQTIPEGTDTEIAFFGGSFTGIDRGLMIRLLDIAAEYVRKGEVNGIRLSTRPDMIDEEIIRILRNYPIRAVELGLQSMDDGVLLASRRGHTAKQAENACRLLTGAEIPLVGQMMIGLPGSTPESEIMTAKKICALGACAARIYPTVVFRNTALATLTEHGNYLPLTLEDAVERSADVLEILLENGVSCLRIGLCASEDLTSPEQAIAGANHPALGELVWSRIRYRQLVGHLSETGLLGKEIVLYVPEKEISRIVGQHRSNLERLWQETGTKIRKIRGVPGGGSLRAELWNQN